MKKIILLLKNIKNLFPYLAIIAIYFFFISLELNKENKLNSNIEENYKLPKNNRTVDEKVFRINIPVIPYKE